MSNAYNRAVVVGDVSIVHFLPIDWVMAIVIGWEESGSDDECLRGIGVCR